MAEVKEIQLLNGGLLKYRLPNVLEQLEFFNKSGWYRMTGEGDEKKIDDIYVRTIRAIEASRPFILEITGPLSTLDDLLQDRENTDALTKLAWDLTSTKVTDEEKKT